MESKEIVLYWEDIPISTLSKIDGKYVHKINYINLKEALNRGCSETIVASNEGTWEELPPIFYEVETTPGREDVYNILGIEKGDNRFDKLYKKALKHELFNKNNFWIGAKENSLLKK